MGRVAKFCALIGLFSAHADAQVTPPIETDGPSEELRRYTVEMIVFEYADRSLDGNEVFVPEAVDPGPEQDNEDGERVFTDRPGFLGEFPTDSKISLEEIPLAHPSDMFLMKPDEFTMREIYSKLERLDAYRPIMHTAWTQTTVDRNLTAPIRLRMLGNAPLRLDGTLTLYLSRYLHLVVDLTLDGTQLPSTYAGDSVSGYRKVDEFSDKPDLRPAGIRYRINEDRIFKSGDLRYFDHPRFGVLVKVTRYEPREGERNPADRMLSGTASQ